MQSEDLKASLTEEQWRVTQEKGTEDPYKNKYYNFFEKGVYLCVCCKELLFSSEEKEKSSTGWPSFAKGASESALTEEVTSKKHKEVTCSKQCGAHLGHKFESSSSHKGRYCINSASLLFKE